MRFESVIGFALGILLLAGCGGRKTNSEAPQGLLGKLLQKMPDSLSVIWKNPQKYRLQILYTQIDREADNQPRFRSHHFRTNSTRYFYPASTVKLPAALLALEKLNKLNIDGLNRETPLKIDSAATGQSRVRGDSSAAGGEATIGHYIKKIFLVSDNDAFNRLYEFLGQQYITETLREKGFRNSRIIRRLESGMGPEQNRMTNPVTFYHNGAVVYRQPLVVNPDRYKIDMQDVRQGKGVMRGGLLHNEPIDFSHSNYISIMDLQAYVKAVMFPEAVPEKMRFNLTEDDYRFLFRYMAMLPRESSDPVFPDTSYYYDSYVKFLIYGDSKKRMPAHIRIFSKSGMAYGYLLDTAYIVDFENKVEFLLTVVLQVNENQIYNDDDYEYDSLGVPFLAELGRIIYDYELTRERAREPDLSRFEVH